MVVASGSIMDGQQPEGSIGGDTLAGIFSDLREDEKVKAIVLRIDSGGGSAFASEIIRDSINDNSRGGSTSRGVHGKCCCIGGLLDCG